MKEVEINGDNDGEGGGGEDSGGFDLDTFKQNLVDTYNKNAETSITKDNIIMPDAFVKDENFSYDEEQLPASFIDTDLTQFLASICLGIPNICPLYLKDTLIDNDNNIYFGIYGNGIRLMHYNQFSTVNNVNNMQDITYNGNLDLSNYEYLFSEGII